MGHLRATPQAGPKAWGVRLRRALAAADPELPPRRVQLPALWDDVAAETLAALAPGAGPVGLRAAADIWLGRLPPMLAEAGRDLLLTRRAAPDAGIWQGRADAFAINVAAFEEPGLGLDAAALRRAAADTAAILRRLDPDGQPALRVTDLDGALAAAGLEYGSKASRDAAVAMLTAVREAAPEARLLGRPGLVDGLLGAEAGGIAPRFDWLDPRGRLSRAALAFLAARGQSAEAALAAGMAGRPLLVLADAAAHAAMREALAGLLDLPPVARPDVPAGRRDMPARSGGFARRVSLGGHKVFVRTAEFADGSLGEVSLGLPKESAAVRAMADGLSQLTSLALQHGLPLADIVELFAGTRFGPAGAVDGDPQTPAASSPLDYLARSLAAAYLPNLALDPPELEAAPAPSLPLDMPLTVPKLRVVR